MSSRTSGAPSPLRLARQLRGMEIADVARALDCTPAWVGSMELGRRPIPAATLPRLAEVLGVPVGMLTGEAVVVARGADGWVVALPALVLTAWRQSGDGTGYGYRYRQCADGSRPVQVDRAGWCVRAPAGGEQVEGPETGAAGEALADAAAVRFGWTLSGLPAPAPESGGAR